LNGSPFATGSEFIPIENQKSKIENGKSPALNNAGLSEIVSTIIAGKARRAV
jgi:hypothetical protein